MGAENPKFWMAALMQGGGGGIWGDFLFNDMTRFGQSPAATLSGPMFGFAGDVLKVTVGNAQKAFDPNQKSSFLLDSFNLGARTVPFANAWWGRAAYRRGFIDSINEIADPNFYKKQKRQEKNLNDKGSGMLWKPATFNPFN